MDIKIIRRCQYCHKSIDGSHKSRKACNNTCKKYAMEVRQGKREPVPRPEEVQIGSLEELEAEKEQLKDLEKEYISIGVQIKGLKKERERIKEEELSQFKECWSMAQNNEFYYKRKVREGVLSDEQIEGWETLIDEQRGKAEKFRYTYERGLLKEKKAKLLLKNCLLQQFRILEKIGDLKSKHLNIKTKGVPSASQLKEMELYQTVFPFDEALISDDDLYALGKQPKPFTCMIYGDRDSGKTILALTLCVALLERFRSKILYVADRQQINKGLYSLIQERTESPLFSVCKADTPTEINTALEKDNFEFLFIDACNYFKLEFTAIRNIMKKYPKLSIFCICHGSITTIRENMRVVFEVREGAGKIVKGIGNDMYYLMAWSGAPQWSDDVYEEEEEEEEEIEDMNPVVNSGEQEFTASQMMQFFNLMQEPYNDYLKNDFFKK